MEGQTMTTKARAIKRLLATVLGGATSLVIAACYGVYQCVRVRMVSGRVTYQQQGVPGIQVCGQRSCTRTDQDGNYSVEVCDEGDPQVPVSFRDVDGPANGGEFRD